MIRMLLFFFILFSLLSPFYSRAIISTRDEKPEEPPKLDDAFVLKQIVSKCRFVEIWNKLNHEDRKITDLNAEHIANYTDPLKLEEGDFLNFFKIDHFLQTCIGSFYTNWI